MKYAARILTFVMLAALCVASFGMVAGAEEPATARLHYVAGGWWPSTDGTMGSSTTVSITGEGYYTVKAQFLDQGGWTPTGNSIQNLYLVVEQGAVEGNVMAGKYLGVSAVRVNGAAVSVGNVGYGPCGYDNAGAFTANDAFAVLYDAYSVDNGTAIWGQTMWNGGTPNPAAVSPSDFSNVTTVEVDFFVTDTQGEKPTMTVRPTIDLSDITLPSQTYLTLEGARVWVSDIERAIPDFVPYLEEGKIKIKDYSATKVTYLLTDPFADGSMTLKGDAWESPALNLANLNGCYVTYVVDDLTLDFNGSSLQRTTLVQGGSRIVLLSGDNPLLDYNVSGGRISNEYDKSTGKLVNQFVYKTGEGHAQYDADGNLVKLSLSACYYFPGKGWCSDFSGSTPCDAPAGYEAVNEAWINTNYPHEIPVVPSMPTLSVNLPSITFPTSAKATLGEMDIDLDAIIDAFPAQIQVHYSNGRLTVQSIGGYYAEYVDYSSYEYSSLEDVNGVWNGSIPQTAEEFASTGGVIYMGDDDWQASYTSAGELELVMARSSDFRYSIEIDLSADNAYVQIFHEDANGYRVWTMYDPATGKVKNQNGEIFVSGGSKNIFYESDGSLRHAAYNSYEQGIFLMYYPNEGWFDSTSNEPASAPDVFAGMTAQQICAEMPCTFTTAKIPAPAPKVSIPEYTVKAKTFKTLAETGLPIEEIIAGIPEKLEIRYFSWGMFIKNIGAVEMTAEHIGTYERYTASKSSPIEWQIRVQESMAEMKDPGYWFYFTGPNNAWRITYTNDTWNGYASLKNLGLNGRMVGVEYTTGNFYIMDQYNKDTGKLYSHNVEDKNGDGRANYDGDGRLKDFSMIVDDVSYAFNPETGWEAFDYMTGQQYVPTTLPAGYEDVDTLWVYENYPPQMEGFVMNVPMPDTWDAVLPADLTVIEAKAFMGTKITSAYIPDGVTTIGASAFANCAGLEWVYIPASVTSIDASAFSGCTDVVLFVANGSAAEAFAEANGFTCVTR